MKFHIWPDAFYEVDIVFVHNYIHLLPLKLILQTIQIRPTPTISLKIVIKEGKEKINVCVCFSDHLRNLLNKIIHRLAEKMVHFI